MSSDKFWALVAQAVGVAMVHFFIFVTSIAFSIQEGGDQPFIAQTLMHVLAFPIVSLLFLLPADFGSFQNWGNEAIFIAVAVLNSAAWGAAVIWTAGHWKQWRGQAG